MGRFYEAATPTWAQGMIADLDTELMSDTLDVHDKAKAKSLDDADKVSDLFAELNNLTFDDEEVNKLRDKYNQ